MMPLWFLEHLPLADFGKSPFQEQEHFQKIGRQHGVVVASALDHPMAPGDGPRFAPRFRMPKTIKNPWIFWTQMVILYIYDYIYN